MISLFSKKNEFRIRQNILKGVYEENLVILGRLRPTLSRRRSFLNSKVILTSLMCLLAVLAQGRYIDTSMSPAELIAQTRADHAGPVAPSPVEVPVNAAASADLNTFNNGQALPLSRMFGLKIKTIMIDAGHGGEDTGCIGKMGTMEKDLTLDIAKRLKTHLINSGRYRVLMTRESDRTVPLGKRVEIAREAKADLFISIHLNYLPQKPINIIETYYFGPSSDQKTLKLAEQENAGSEYGLSDFRNIVEKLGKTMKLQESREFAESIQANLFRNSKKKNTDIQDFGVKRAPFVVLLGPEVPSVLAEVSCLSNREEEQELASDTHREDIARYLAAGIYDYLNKGDLTHEAKR